MPNIHRPYVKLDAQLVRYHKEELLTQIAALKDQIEINLRDRQSIKHLKNLITERQLYLSEYLDEPQPSVVRAKKASNRESAHHQNAYKQ